MLIFLRDFLEALALVRERQHLHSSRPENHP
jgi:hypothetical protein